MKITFPAALTISLVVAVSADAADKGTKKKTGAVPPKSKMIAVPPADPASNSGEPQKLITSEMSGQDLQFFTAVVEAGRLQAYLMDLLGKRAQSEQIKALAGGLVETQEQENKQIARLAASKGWPVSVEPTAAQRTIGAELEKQQGPRFDKAVMEKLLAASRQAVAAYETAAQSTDKDIKNFAGQMAPLAQEKLLLIERLTGTGKTTNSLFRTGAVPQPEPEATPKPEPGATPPAIIPSKRKPAATPPAASTPPAATPSAKSEPPPSLGEVA